MQNRFNISMSNYVLYNRLKRRKIYGIKKFIAILCINKENAISFLIKQFIVIIFYRYLLHFPQ